MRLILLLLASACASVRPPVERPDRQQPDEVSLTMARRAHTSFAEAEGEGWTEERCRDVAAGFEEAQERRGPWADATYMLGLVAERCGDETASIQAYRRALQLESSHCEANAALGAAKLRAGEADEALPYYQTAAASPRCAAGYLGLAEIQGRSPQTRDTAVANVRRALAIDASNVEAFYLLARLHYRRGQGDGQAASGELDLGELVCHHATQLDATFAPIWNLWGRIALVRGEINDALRYFERAIELDEQSFEAHMNYATLNLRFRGYEVALRSFAAARGLDEQSYEARLGWAIAQRGLGEIARAQAELEALIEDRPQRPEAYFNLALVFHHHREGALSDFQSAQRRYQEFLQRAEGAELQPVVEEVARRCRSGTSRCRPGALQQLETINQVMRQ